MKEILKIKELIGDIRYLASELTRIQNLCDSLEFEIHGLEQTLAKHESLLKTSGVVKLLDIIEQLKADGERLDWIDREMAQIDAYWKDEEDGIAEDMFVYHNSDGEMFEEDNIRTLIDKARKDGQ